MKGEDMASLIEKVGERITEYVYGEGEKKQLQMHYETVDQGQGWSLLQETRDTGSAGRIGFFNHGGRAFCSYREVNVDGGEKRYAYSLCRFSPYITGFPLDEFYYLLNRVEGSEHSANDSWGGGDSTGGSPRKSLSKLAPQQFKSIIDSYLGFRDRALESGESGEEIVDLYLEKHQNFIEQVKSGSIPKDPPILAD
jgi:hypothetical protein